MSTHPIWSPLRTTMRLHHHYGHREMRIHTEGQAPGLPPIVRLVIAAVRDAAVFGDVKMLRHANAAARPPMNQEVRVVEQRAVPRHVRVRAREEIEQLILLAGKLRGGRSALWLCRLVRRLLVVEGICQRLLLGGCILVAGAYCSTGCSEECSEGQEITQQLGRMHSWA